MEPVISQLSGGKTSAPVIGVSGSRPTSKSVQAMLARVREAGARSLLLANHAERDAAKDIRKMDAVILMGNGFDVDPSEYIGRYLPSDPRGKIHPQTKSVASTPATAARAAYEKRLIDLVLESKMPLFSICGGMQQLNVRCGGTLHQHIPDITGHDKHARNAGMEASSPVIPVQIVEGTLLARIAATRGLYAPGFPPIVPGTGTVNSFHHQAVDYVGTDLIPCAYSDSYTLADGSKGRLIEAIEADPDGRYKDQFLLGVQWHPEFLPDNQSSQRIINNVTVAAGQYAEIGSRTHSQEEIEHENILSALPMLREMSSATRTLTQDVKPDSTPQGKISSGKSR